jgi:hypothetical protein
MDTMTVDTCRNVLIIFIHQGGSMDARGIFLIDVIVTLGAHLRD